jgi:hypothetical protein
MDERMGRQTDMMKLNVAYHNITHMLKNDDYKPVVYSI